MYIVETPSIPIYFFSDELTLDLHIRCCIIFSKFRILNTDQLHFFEKCNVETPGVSFFDKMKSC
jgi:hypothetical protein